MHKSRTLAMILTLLALVLPAQAQDDTIRLTIAIPEWQESTYREGIFDDFEAANPGVEVETVISGENTFFGSTVFSDDPTEVFDTAATFAASADVLQVSTWNMQPEVVRAGIFLDLMPLVSSDTSLDVNDFYPAAWEAYQWDGGMWAMPFKVSPNLLIYDAAAFDAAGLAYPDASWTIDDYATAFRALAVYGEDGSVERPAMITFTARYLLASLYNDNFYDENTLPAAPDFSDPALVELLQQWTILVEEGVIGEPNSNTQFNEMPIMVSQPWQLFSGFGQDENTLAGALLPNGRAGLDVEGFAISAGTPYPELAYELLKYLNTNPIILNNSSGTTPARRSMVGVEAEDEMIIRPDIPEDVQALIDQGIENGIIPAEFRFYEYIDFAVNGVIREGSDLVTALTDAEVQASENLALADDYALNNTVLVERPDPVPELAEGEVALRFRLSLPISPMPNREAWEQFLEEFAANDPGVGYVELESGFGMPDEDNPPDCVYQSFNPVPNMDMSDPQYLSLDPFVDADPNYDEADFIGDTLARVQRDNRLWGLPVVITPMVMRYDPDAFAEAGLMDPADGWTIDSFAQALPMLDSMTEDDISAFRPSGGPNYLYMLIAAYGGQIFDTSTNPPTITLTDPTTFDAIRQVLELARQGYIDYRELEAFGGGFFGGPDMQPPLISESLSPFNFRIRMTAEGEDIGFEDNTRLTTYPVGATYTPVAFDVGSLFIDARTLHPEACYRLMTAISQRPSLLFAMPARRSYIDLPDVEVAQGSDLVSVYRDLADMMAAPNALYLPSDSGFNYRDSFIELEWINDVFDQYVLEGGDLETLAADAEQDIALYRECTAQIPDYTPEMSEDEAQSLFRERAQCAISIDPEAARFYPTLEEE